MFKPNLSLQPMLDKLSLWGNLGAADRAAVLALPHRVRVYQPHQHVVRERERPSHACVMLSGFSMRHKLVGDGGRQILSIHMKGDFVDLQNAFLGTADHSVQTLTRCEVALIPCEAVRELALARPAVGMAMWQDTLVDGSIFREWLANIGRRDARSRVAHLLCELGLRLKSVGVGQASAFELPMTQDQLADAVALTSVHVNRTLRNLERDGVISRSKRSLTIADWAKLALAGDFDSEYLHLEDRELAAVCA